MAKPSPKSNPWMAACGCLLFTAGLTPWPTYAQQPTSKEIHASAAPYQNPKGSGDPGTRPFGPTWPHSANGVTPANGKFITGKRGELDLALEPGTWKRLRAQGLNAELSLTAPPGAYRLRTVVQKSSDGKLSAFSQPVVIQ